MAGVAAADCDLADEVWLVIQHANSATRSVSHRDAVEEALCFGWIDSLAHRRDAESLWQQFTPRTPRSAWSNVNRELVERLTALGLMTPPGQAAVDLAKRTGTWSMLADAQNGIVPNDLRQRNRPGPTHEPRRRSVQQAAREQHAPQEGSPVRIALGSVMPFRWPIPN